MDIRKLSDTELVREIAGRCITNLAAVDLAQFIRQCVQDSAQGLVIYCCKCGEQIINPGALLFSPPDKNGNCWKEHVCAECYARRVALHTKNSAPEGVTDTLFIDHIKSHLNPEQKVICKICYKSVEEIYAIHAAQERKGKNESKKDM